MMPLAVAAARGIPSAGGLALLWVIAKFATATEVASVAAMVAASLGISLFSRFGFDIVGIKRIPVLLANGLDLEARTLTLKFSLTSTAVAGTIAFVLYRADLIAHPIETALCSASFSLLVVSSISLRAADRVIRSSFCEVGYTLLFASAVAALLELRDVAVNYPLLVTIISIFHGGVSWCAARKRLSSFNQNASPQRHVTTANWSHAESFNFLMISAIGYLYAQGYVWLGSLRLGVGDSAALGVISRLVFTINFALVIANAMYNHKYAIALSRSDYKEVSFIARRALRVMLMFAIPPAAVAIFFPAAILNAFGVDGAAARTTLVLLSLGQLVNVLTGNSAAILNLSGHEKIVRNVMAATSVVALVCLYFLTPRYGIVAFGAVFAGAIANQNLALVFILHAKLGINIYKSAKAP